MKSARCALTCPKRAQEKIRIASPLLWLAEQGRSIARNKTTGLAYVHSRAQVQLMPTPCVVLVAQFLHRFDTTLAKK